MSGAWKLSQEASASLSLANVWTTPGGTATKPPGPTVWRSGAGADRECELALQHVEGVRVLAVDVQVRTALAPGVA